MITVVIKLTKGDVLYVLVGQEGESACVHNGVETREGLCSQMVKYNNMNHNHQPAVATIIPIIAGHGL